MKITFVLWDDATDGVAVKHDDQTVWTESTFGRLGQYLRHYAPTGEPVEIVWEVVEGGQVTETSAEASS